MISGRASLAGSGVYAIRCSASGQLYIGGSIAIPTRLAGHEKALRRGRHENKYLQRAWVKYGAEAFECYVIEYVNDRELITGREQAHREAAGQCSLFNIATQAGKPPSLKGIRRSKAATEATASKLRGRTLSQEQRDKISASQRGRPKSLAHRRRLRWTQERRTRQSAYYKTPEAIAKQSAAAKTRWAKRVAA